VNGDDPQDVPLSPAGVARRESILADALRAADGRRRTRAGRNLAAAVFAVALASSLVVFVARSPHAQTHAVSPPAPGASAQPSPVPTSRSAQRSSPSTASDTARVVVQIIPAEHVERRWQVIDDEQLIAALAAAGKPGGVARLNGKAVIVPLQ
jgi:hypothetical protein